MIKQYFTAMFTGAKNHNDQDIMNLLEMNDEARFCDLGCDDGLWTKKLTKKIGTKDVYGIEIVDGRRKLAEERGIKAKTGDLNQRLPFEDNFFDAVHSNQVIEHLYDTTNFIKEIKRVLKPGGYAVVSTENASSWHNIFALMLGWQMFSLTNIDSERSGVGNPLSIHRLEPNPLKTWEHQRIFSYRGLKEVFEVQGFTVEAIECSGYYPFPWWFAKIDPRHGHFITIKIRKPLV